MPSSLNPLIFILLGCYFLQVSSDEEYKCPANQFYLYPCRCLVGGYKGLDLLCERSNLATVALALDNVKQPINTLTVTKCNISRLYGPIFKDKKIYSLNLLNSNLEEIDNESFSGLKTELRSLQLNRNKFKSIPESINNELHNLTQLVVSNTASITEVKGNSFKKLTNLVEIDLHNNSIRKIDSTTFATLLSLEKLDLSHNKLSKIERNIFRTNRKLSYLDLSHNKFKELGKSDFNDLVAVTTLNLSHNELRELPRSIFGRVSQLRVLNLSGNQFKQIDSYMLRGVRFLKEFLASHNQIQELTKNSFASTTRIKLIDLSYNDMLEVETEIFKDMQWLDWVDLSYNRIHKLKTGSFQKMFKIGLNLSHNNISAIEYKAFQELGNITELDLSYNKINNLKANIFEECDCTIFKLNHNQITNLSHVNIFTNLTGIRMLNLSHNAIVDVNKKHFTTKKLYELHTIDLSYNNISDVSGNVFEKFLSIRLINLTHNNIQKINYNAFGSLPTLLDLDLSHNQIREIANGGVSNLLSVKTIYLNNNQIEKMFPISMAINTIHVEHNRIREIRPNLFPMINAVLAIHLDHNNISKLEDNSFANCLSLNTLSLSHNRLVEVPQHALAPLTSLQNLDLSYNQLHKLDRTAFGTLRILFKLNLSHNKISNMSSNAFEGLLQLLQLNLSHNAISELSTDVFNTMVSLRTLDISHNQISVLDNTTHSIFEQLLSLEQLNLSHNHISLVREKSFPHSPWIPYKLQHLDLSFNTIPVLTSHFDNGLSKLKWLSLRGNLINEIYPNTLGNLTQLQHIDLSSNDLRKLSKGVFQPTMNSLEKLDLGSNKIASMVFEEFSQMSALKWLNFSYNRLTHIDERLFDKIKHHNMIFYFTGNHLYCDCNLMPLVAWVNHEKHKAELEGRKSQIYQHWSNLHCQDPKPVKNKQMLSIRADMLDCNNEAKEKYRKYFQSASSIKVRTIQKYRKRRQDSIKVVWFVQNQIDDIAAFNVILHQEGQNSLLINETVNYLKRFFIFNNLPTSEHFKVCILPIDSRGEIMRETGTECVQFYNDHSQVVFNADQNDRTSNSHSSLQTSTKARPESDTQLFTTCLYLVIALAAKNLFI